MKEVTTKVEFDNIVKSDGLVVAYFTAEWCGPCQAIRPVLDKLEAEHTHITFLKIDVDVNEETATAENVNAMPTFKFYKNGGFVHEFAGADKDRLSVSVMDMTPQYPTRIM